MMAIRNYLSLIKFSHTVFAMPFALIGFVLGVSSLQAESPYVEIEWNFYTNILLLVVLCMVFARSAAMAFNRYLDRHFDARNPRTALREIPAGIISANSALWFTIVMSALFVGATWFINLLCFVLSPVALAVILGYSFTKRFTPLCHLVLGLGLSLAPIGAYLAVTGSFSLLPILFSAAVFCWVGGFDIIYALQDEEFDKAQGLQSIPAAVGKVRALQIARLLHAAAVLFLFTAAFAGSFGLMFSTGLAFFSGMLIYQHTLVRPDDLRRVNLAFFTTNGIASVVFAVMVILDILL
ncbi:MAG TPA: UbiA-like polyprenyltransferase [Lacibacter sp.]|nr:UbiA-like polyprenyltransferase [Lacibacter sp.]HMO89342.1 UbiA-like polyprenyltransferase [Lacibacter sp.]HMP86846.1 UbiA-like polyprenyltransferase [Lacibacter sp.]